MNEDQLDQENAALEFQVQHLESVQDDVRDELERVARRLKTREEHMEDVVGADVLLARRLLKIMDRED